MIRERDRALHDRDRTTGTNKEEVEKLKRELRLAIERAETAERQKGSEISSMLSKYNREMADLEEALRVRIVFESSSISYTDCILVEQKPRSRGDGVDPR